jgi:histone deacetylase 1/2
MATSSTHAELKALYSLSIDLIYLIHLFTELGRPVALPCVALEDNSACIEITKDTSSRLKHCKHYLMLVQFVREQVNAGLIQVQKVPTEDNLADILTKIVTGEDFLKKKDLLLSISDDIMIL